MFSTLLLSFPSSPTIYAGRPCLLTYLLTHLPFSPNPGQSSFHRTGATSGPMVLKLPWQDLFISSNLFSVSILFDFSAVFGTVNHFIVDIHIFCDSDVFPSLLTSIFNFFSWEFWNSKNSIHLFYFIECHISERTIR